MRAGYVRRFSPVERLLHWVNAVGFFFLLTTGLILYLPRLSVLVARRQFIQSIHFWGGVAWLAVLAAVLLLGARRLLKTARDLETFDHDDLVWLRGGKAPQGRFNAGQKINAALTAAFTILFVVSTICLPWSATRERSSSRARPPVSDFAPSMMATALTSPRSYRARSSTARLRRPALSDARSAPSSARREARRSRIAAAALSREARRARHPSSRESSAYRLSSA